MKISYTYVAIDIFHYGHLKLLETAKSISDLHICGLLSDEVCINWNGNIIMNYNERLKILESLNCVDEVIQQQSIDPTNNLKLINKRYPESKLILFQGHQDWGNMPGTDYINSINGDVVKPEFYPRITRTFIREELNKTNKDSVVDIESYVLGNISFFSINTSTKADTLKNLTPRLNKSKIEKLFVFNVSDWNDFSEKIVNKIKNNFQNLIIVRSSSIFEDGMKKSNAGMFHSELDVNSQSEKNIYSAIEKVINSYSENGKVDPKNQILIQSQTNNVKYSGVVLTRDINQNSPYYVINYDKGERTDTVTSGQINNNIKIARNVDVNKIKYPWKLLIESVEEIEELLDGLALDIEFAINKDNEVIIFQVRPLAAINKFIDIDDEEIFKLVNSAIHQYNSLSKKSLNSHSYTLSDMSFWNPAEIIGSRSDELSYSLYYFLILNKAWTYGLSELGYNEINRPLMIRLLNKPYIEVETAFYGLHPIELNDDVQKILIDYYINKLKGKPELHDKIEFEISFNCFSPITDFQLKEVEPLLDEKQFLDLRNCLINITNNIFQNFENIYDKDILSLNQLEQQRKNIKKRYQESNLNEKIKLILDLIKDATELGTPQFSRMARLAFIGNQYIKGFVKTEVIKQKDADNIFKSIETVASELNRDYNKVLSKELHIKDFTNVYGHLRPGTYNINSLPYHKSKDYFNITKDIQHDNAPKSNNKFNEVSVKKKISQFLENFEIKISVDELFYFIEKTTKCRELFKFEFTKNLSLALEWLSEIGDSLGFDRSELSYLSLENLKGISNETPNNEIYELWAAQINGKRIKHDLSSYLTLPPLIFEKNDIRSVEYYSSWPTFITSKRISSEIIYLESLDQSQYNNISNKIVIIENADPGYDWMFAKNISGLITKYGGAASHMAIRCAEFDIPAAIGCGELIFDKIKKAKSVDLDCKNKLITNL